MKFQEAKDNYLQVKSNLELVQERLQQVKKGKGINPSNLDFETYLKKSEELEKQLNINNLETKLVNAETKLISQFIELAKQPEHLQQLPEVTYEDLKDLEGMTHIQSVADKLVELALMLEEL